MVHQLLSPGRVVGPYVVQGLLGRTPWATTYAALTPPNRHVALKLFEPAISNAPGVLDGLEAALVPVTQVVDPAVLRPLDAGEDDENGEAFVVTALCHYPSLAELVAVSPLPLEEVVRVLTHVGRALDGGIPHLSLKASNVFVGPPPSYDVFLADFGMDVLRRAHRRDGDASDTTWLAPEQLSTAIAEPARADVYASGILAWFALTGDVLPTGESLAEAFDAHAVTHDAPFSPPLGEVLRRALAAEPADRFASVSELAEALRGVVGANASPTVADASKRHAKATLKMRSFQLPGQIDLESSSSSELAPSPEPSAPMRTAMMPSFNGGRTSGSISAPPAPPPPSPRSATLQGAPKLISPQLPSEHVEERAPAQRTQRLAPFSLPRAVEVAGGPMPARSAPTARRPRFRIGRGQELIELARRRPVVAIAVSALVVFASVALALFAMRR
jgi:serine/threonine-protein kinase